MLNYCFHHLDMFQCTDINCEYITTSSKKNPLPTMATTLTVLLVMLGCFSYASMSDWTRLDDIGIYQVYTQTNGLTRSVASIDPNTRDVVCVTGNADNDYKTVSVTTGDGSTDIHIIASTTTPAEATNYIAGCYGSANSGQNP